MGDGSDDTGRPFRRPVFMGESGVADSGIRAPDRDVARPAGRTAPPYIPFTNSTQSFSSFAASGKNFVSGSALPRATDLRNSA